MEFDGIDKVYIVFPYFSPSFHFSYSSLSFSPLFFPSLLFVFFFSTFSYFLLFFFFSSFFFLYIVLF